MTSEESYAMVFNKLYEKGQQLAEVYNGEVCIPILDDNCTELTKIENLLHTYVSIISHIKADFDSLCTLEYIIENGTLEYSNESDEENNQY